MEQIVPILLNVRGDLDTANPVTDRAPGALVQAREVHPRYWGPRVGSQSFARVWESPGTAALYDYVTVTGAGTGGLAQNYEDAFGELGTKFTLDLWVNYPSAAYSAGSDKVGIYGLVRGNAQIDVGIMGASHADNEKVRVRIVTTNSSGVADSAVVFTGSTRISVGSTQVNRHHIRVVRDGATATLYLNGASDGSTSSLSATHGIHATSGSATQVFLHYGNDYDALFRGRIFGAVLRDGAFTTQPIEATMPANPWGRNVHHYYLGRVVDFGGDDHFFDAGPFQAHARISASNYTSTTSNDNAAPAPAIVQGIETFSTRTNRTASVVVAGGQIHFAAIS